MYMCQLYDTLDLLSVTFFVTAMKKWKEKKAKTGLHQSKKKANVIKGYKRGPKCPNSEYLQIIKKH